MGHVLSSGTVYAAAYLTDLGRKYLFDPITNNRFTTVTDVNGNVNTVDAFKIVYFSMSDPDCNYNITYGQEFQTGDIANISGKNEDCIKGSIISEEENLISVNGEIDGVNGLTPNGAIDIGTTYSLGTNMPNDSIGIDVNNIPTSPTI